MKKVFFLFYFISYIMSLYLIAETESLYIEQKNTTQEAAQQNSEQTADNLYTQELPYEAKFTEKIHTNRDIEDDFKKAKVYALKFIAKEDPTASDQTGQEGYFWDKSNPDITAEYQGTARINQERFINVIPVDSQDQDFDTESRIYLGTLYNQQDHKTYYLYGQYTTDVIPECQSQYMT